VEVPIDYQTPGVFTDLRPMDADLFPAGLSPIEICALVSGLIVEPDDGQAAGIAVERMDERNLRSARTILARLIALAPEAIDHRRAPEHRVVGTCRHFAVVACALLRREAIASRVRCGFATYFQAGRAVDHWIVEYRDRDRDGWARVDPEVLGGSVIDHAHDLAPADFFSGAEAWAAHRAGRVDPDTFGVYGTENWGAGEIRGNLVRDLAALNKVEMLPWDDWGKMDAGYDETAGPEYDELLDRCARSCTDDDRPDIAQLFTAPELHVPDEIFSQTE
jgi:hypothetical protein